MIRPKLAKIIGSGKATNVHASITTEDMGKSISIFDNNLSALCTALREATDGVHFNFNASAESYQICLPRMKKAVAKLVTKVLSDSPVCITADAHFGALY